MEYILVRVKDEKEMRRFRGVKRITNIPSNCVRLFFENNGNCKINVKTNKELREVDITK